jgi:hypothetical protein
MENFVCVRMVQGNGMDLSLFQFDYDMSFAVFFLNADRTIYGRYGTRSKKPKEAHSDISLEGLAAAMKATLALHKKYPANRATLTAKTGPQAAFAVPERMPALKEKFRSELAQGDKKTISRSCIHCHQIRDAERSSYFANRKPLPSEVLFPWPMPEVIGMVFDRKKRATLTAVTGGSPAARGGLQTGDEVLKINGQPIISIADVQWVLHHAPEEAELQVAFRRASKLSTLKVTLPASWRQESDLSWRTSSWALRRMTSGGLVLEELTAAERRSSRIESGQLALKVTHVGQYNKHAAAKRAGFRKGDVIVSYDGTDTDWRETDFFAYVLAKKKPGDRVPTTVLRGKQTVNLKLPVQD